MSRRGAVHLLLLLLAVALPLWIDAIQPPLLAWSYGRRFVAFELLGFTLATALAVIGALELRARRPASWRDVVPVILPLLVALDTLVFFSELARKPFDYDCYEYAARAWLLGEDPYRVGLNYLYPPLTAQALAGVGVACAAVASWLGFAPGQEAVWDAVFYLYQCAQIGLVVGLYFLAFRFARRSGIPAEWAGPIVAALLLFDHPLLRTLRHGQVNLWVLDGSLLALLWSQRRPALAGLALAVAAHVKIYPLVLLLPFVAAGAWRSVLWTGAGLLLVFAVQTGGLRDFTLWEQFAAFYTSTFPGELAFRNASFHSVAVNTLRFVVGVDPRGLRSAVRAAATLFSLAMLGWLVLRVWRRRRDAASGASLEADGADALAFSLLISQSVWEHHYLFALPLMIRTIALRGRDAPWAVAAAGFLALWMPTFDLFPLGYHRAAGLLGMLWLTRPSRPRHGRGLARPAAAACALLALSGCGGAPPAGPPIVLVSLDTLRADHLQPYGYGRATSPVLSRFARQAVRFDAAHAHATATLPSHLSLLTSLLPPEIGITRPGGPHLSQRTTRLRLAEPVVTLAEVLRDHGYRTAAFTDGGYVHPFYGFDQGFDHFAVTSPQEGAYRNGFRQGIRKLVAWLADHADDPAPPFLFLHTYDVHEPYSPPKPFDRAFTDVDYAGFREARGFEARPVLLSQRRDELTPRDVQRAIGFYDNGVLATDRALGGLFAILRKHGLYDPSILVVLSDHGEEFLDHGDFGHGPSVYQELARVPLLVRLPGGAHAGRVVDRPVGLVDVAPTLLDLAGIEVPGDFRGRSLRGVIEGADPGDWLERRPLYVDVPDVTQQVAALRRGDWKLVRRGERRELYHLGRDPEEQRDLAPEEPGRVRDLDAELTRRVAEMRAQATSRAVPADAPHPAEQEAALRALGYLE